MASCRKRLSLTPLILTASSHAKLSFLSLRWLLYLHSLFHRKKEKRAVKVRREVKKNRSRSTVLVDYHRDWPEVVEKRLLLFRVHLSILVAFRMLSSYLSWNRWLFASKDSIMPFPPNEPLFSLLVLLRPFISVFDDPELAFLILIPPNFVILSSFFVSKGCTLLVILTNLVYSRCCTCNVFQDSKQEHKYLTTDSPKGSLLNSMHVRFLR